jgi:hypothetical protein
MEKAAARSAQWFRGDFMVIFGGNNPMNDDD